MTNKGDQMVINPSVKAVVTSILEVVMCVLSGILSLLAIFLILLFTAVFIGSMQP